MLSNLKSILPALLLIVVVFFGQSCDFGAGKVKEAQKGENEQKKRAEAYMDSISNLQTRMTELIKSGKASTEEIESLQNNLKSMQGQLAGSMEALRAEQGKNAELASYVSKMEGKIKNQETQISGLMEQVAKLETENKEQKKTIEEQKAENEAAQKLIHQKDSSLVNIKNQQEFTSTLSSLQDKYNAAFEKAKAAKGRDECTTFKEAYKYAKQMADLCDGKEDMVKQAGKSYATVMDFKTQVLKRAEADMSKRDYAKCFSGYK